MPMSRMQQVLAGVCRGRKLVRTCSACILVPQLCSTVAPVPARCCAACSAAHSLDAFMPRVIFCGVQRPQYIALYLHAQHNAVAAASSKSSVIGAGFNSPSSQTAGLTCQAHRHVSMHVGGLDWRMLVGMSSLPGWSLSNLAEGFQNVECRNPRPETTAAAVDGVHAKSIETRVHFEASFTRDRKDERVLASAKMNRAAKRQMQAQSG